VKNKYGKMSQLNLFQLNLYWWFSCFKFYNYACVYQIM